MSSQGKASVMWVDPKVCHFAIKIAVHIENVGSSLRMRGKHNPEQELLILGVPLSQPAPPAPLQTSVMGVPESALLGHAYHTYQLVSSVRPYSSPLVVASGCAGHSSVCMILLSKCVAL